MKLYNEVFVEVSGFNGPQAVSVSLEDPKIFNVLGYQYRKDGLPLKSDRDAPRIVLVYSRGCSLHIRK